MPAFPDFSTGREIYINPKNTKTEQIKIYETFASYTPVVYLFFVPFYLRSLFI